MSRVHRDRLRATRHGHEPGPERHSEARRLDPDVASCVERRGSQRGDVSFSEVEPSAPGSELARALGMHPGRRRPQIATRPEPGGSPASVDNFRALTPPTAR